MDKLLVFTVGLFLLGFIFWGLGGGNKEEAIANRAGFGADSWEYLEVIGMILMGFAFFMLLSIKFGLN